VIAVILPFTAWVASGLIWWTPFAAFPVSLGLIWLAGWMVDHTYG